MRGAPDSIEGLTIPNISAMVSPEGKTYATPGHMYHDEIVRKILDEGKYVVQNEEALKYYPRDQVAKAEMMNNGWLSLYIGTNRKIYAEARTPVAFKNLQEVMWRIVKPTEEDQQREIQVDVDPKIAWGGTAGEFMEDSGGLERRLYSRKMEAAMLVKLIKIADGLDVAGMTKEAEIVDGVIEKFAAQHTIDIDARVKSRDPQTARSMINSYNTDIRNIQSLMSNRSDPANLSKLQAIAARNSIKLDGPDDYEGVMQLLNTTKGKYEALVGTAGGGGQEKGLLEMLLEKLKGFAGGAWAGVTSAGRSAGRAIGKAFGQISKEQTVELPSAPGHSLRPDMAGKFESFAQEWRNITGRPLKITDSWRSYESQVRLKAQKGRLAATPGRSRHGAGGAIDINLAASGVRSPAEWMRMSAIGAKHGFHVLGKRFGAAESWHFSDTGA